MNLIRIQNGKQLAAFRAACGMKQAELATLLSVPLKTLQNWEYGQRDKAGLNLYLCPIADFAHLAHVMKGLEVLENSPKK